MNEKLQQFEALCESFDSYYEMSDDVSVWRKGREQETKLKLFAKELYLEFPEEVEEIIDTYQGRLVSAPNMFVFSRKVI